MIEFHHVQKTYRVSGRDVPALQSTDLRIEQGQVFGLIGHSGAGKSTLLRLINRLEEPSGGRVLIDGQDATDAITSWNGLDTWVARVLDAQPGPDGPFACPLATLATELRNSPEYRPALTDAFRTWEGHLAAGLRRIQQHGELDPDANPDRLAASLIAALQGGYLLASVHGRIDVMRDVLDDAVAALRRYQT